MGYMNYLNSKEWWALFNNNLYKLEAENGLHELPEFERRDNPASDIIQLYPALGSIHKLSLNVLLVSGKLFT